MLDGDPCRRWPAHEVFRPRLFGEEYELSLSPGNSPLFHLGVFQTQRPKDSSINSFLRAEMLLKKLGRFLAAVCPHHAFNGYGVS